MRLTLLLALCYTDPMLKRVAVIAIALLAMLVMVIATRPTQMRVERSLSVAAAPDVVFPLINNFGAWRGWSPWEKLDPDMRREVSPVPSGKGATYDWSGNDQVGVGSMEITESTPPKHVKILLQFKEPWEATNVTTFTLSPAEKGGTLVTWSMEGENNFAAKAMGLFMDMDQMIGKDFETGLANLGAMAEGAAELQRAAAVQSAAPANAAAEAAEAGAK